MNEKNAKHAVSVALTLLCNNCGAKTSAVLYVHNHERVVPHCMHVAVRCTCGDIAHGALMQSDTSSVPGYAEVVNPELPDYLGEIVGDDAPSHSLVATKLKNKPS